MSKIKILIKEQSSQLTINDVIKTYGKKVGNAVNSVKLPTDQKKDLKDSLYAALWSHMEGDPNQLYVIKKHLSDNGKSQIAGLLVNLFNNIIRADAAAPVVAMPGRKVASQDLEE